MINATQLETYRTAASLQKKGDQDGVVGYHANLGAQMEQ